MKSITIISTNTTCFKPWIPRNSKVLLCPKTCSRKPTTATTTVRASLQDSQPPNTSQQQQQLNLSVLRFTLGHPTHPSLVLFSIHIHTCHTHTCALVSLLLFIHWLVWFFFFFVYCFRDTWVGWVLLAQMDWLWLCFASALKSLPWFWFCHCYTSPACKKLIFFLNCILLYFPFFHSVKLTYLVCTKKTHLFGQIYFWSWLKYNILFLQLVSI